MFTVEGLTFEYPRIRALDDVSFSIRKGSITALVGPNGAGKTTLLRCLAALDAPVSGNIRLDGVDVQDDPRSCHRMVGYLSDFFGLYDELTVRQCLLYMGMAHAVPRGRALDEAVGKAASRVGLEGRLDEKAGALSRGLRQRLAIAQAVIHEPLVLLLDEPASGLDPEARAALSGLFLGLREEGMTLVVSSHIIAELEEYSTDMAVLRQGKLVDQRTLGTHDASAPLIRLSLVRPSEALPGVLAEVPGVDDVRVDGRQAWFRFSGDEQALHELLRLLIGRGIPVCSFSGEKTNMQQEYMSVVRRGGNAGEARP